MAVWSLDSVGGVPSNASVYAGVVSLYGLEKSKMSKGTVSWKRFAKTGTLELWRIVRRLPAESASEERHLT